MKARLVVVSDVMQSCYQYTLTERVGKSFDSGFLPQLSPRELLAMGVFGGKYMSDCTDEFPDDWFENAKLCSERHDPSLNYFGTNASQPLSCWREKGWIYHEDPRGWFQWYCRYYMGRRGPDDARQIKRWKAMRRHVSQIEKNCDRWDMNCRRRQRQAVLHWAYDSANI
jgi:hypothetical protein